VKLARSTAALGPNIRVTALTSNMRRPFAILVAPGISVIHDKGFAVT
jgi:hypothetical protein